MGALRSQRLQLLVTLGVVWLTFGTAPIGARVGVTHVPPFIFAGARFVLAGLILLAILVVAQRGRLGLTWRELGEAALIGAGLVGIGQGLMNWATTEVLPGVVAMFIATVPLFAAVLGWLVLRSRISALGLAGLAAGAAGTVLLAMPSSGTSVPPGAALAMSAGALAWAGASLFAARSQIGRRPPVLAALQMLMGGLFQLAVALALGEPRALQPGSALEPVVVATFVYLLVGTGILGFISFSWLLGNASPILANSQAYVSPVVAMLAGWALLGEPLTPRALTAAGVGLAGVALLVVAQARVRSASSRAAETELGEAA
jgi:drug/metabolite transporter (DMT)-like permease